MRIIGWSQDELYVMNSSHVLIFDVLNFLDAKNAKIVNFSMKFNQRSLGL